MDRSPLERRPTLDAALMDTTLAELEGEKYDPFSYKQIVEENKKKGNKPADEDKLSSSKKKQQAGMASNLRPKRALFCLSVSNPIRRACIALVEWKPFDFFILANIFATCAVLAAYEPLPSGQISERNMKLEKAEYFFIVVFTLESILKIMAYGFVAHPGAYLRSAWNMLDFFIVVIGFVSLIFEKYINVDVKALRAFRVLRPLRLVTGVPSLQVVLASILKAMIPLFYIALLVVFFIIIYAIIGVELFMGIMHYTCYNATTKQMIDEEPQICSQSPKNGYQCPPGTECLPGWEGPNFGITSFDNMGIAGLTVFTCITLEGWTDVMYYIENSMGNNWIWFYFVTLILLGSFFVLNLILGVLSGEFAKEKARQSKSGKFQKVREKHLIDEAVRGYMDWIAQADEDRDREEKEEKEEKRKRRQKERKAGIQVNGDDMESEGICSNIGGCWAKFVRKSRRKCRAIVKSQTFYWAVIIAVFLNSMVLAVEHYNQPDYVTMFLDRANYFFLCLFCCEMLIKMFCLGFKGYFNSLFNRFDCVVVLSSLLEAAITIPTGMSPIGISVMRCVRLLRIFKVTRYWESLSNLVGSLLNSIKSIASLLLLLALFMLIFSLLGMQIFGGKLDFGEEIEKPRSNYDSFWRAFVTVFQIMTGEDWNACMYFGIKSWGGFNKAEAVVPVVYYISLVVIGNFILLNVFLAIAVDNLADADSMTQLDKEEKKLKKQQKKLRLLQKRGLASEDVESESDEEEEEAENAEEADEGGSLTGSQELKKEEGGESKKARMRPLRMSELNLIKNIPDPLPDSSSFFLFSSSNPFRIYCYKLCTHPYFMNTILVVIMCSSILLAAEDPLGRDKARNLVLDYFDYIFTAVFAVEILVKLIAYGVIVHSGSFCRSAFNILDLLIVAVSIVAIILRNSKEISVVRILRVLRVLRPLRAINRAKGLKHVVQCVIVAIKSIGNIMLVTILFIFLFSVIGIQLFKGTFFYCTDGDVKTPEECQGVYYGPDDEVVERQWLKREFNYDNVFQAMMTLFVVMTFEGWPTILENSMDSTGVDMGPVQDSRPWVSIYYIIYIIVIAFFMMNIFVGFVIVTFQSEGEEEFKDCELDKNQRGCVEYVLEVRPTCRFVPRKKLQYHIWRVVTSGMFEYMIFAFILGNTIVLGAQYWGQPEMYQRILDGFNVGFTMVFLLECVLKLLAFFPKNYFMDPWNIFDFIIVVGSIADIIIGEMSTDKSIKFNFFRLFRALRLVKLLSKGAGIRTLLWTFIKSFQALPYVGLLILLLFFIYAVVGMQVFGNIKLQEHTAINKHNNFQTYFAAVLSLFRASTGENWQQIMNSCLNTPDVLCEMEDTKTCGTHFAYFYFISFNMICSFLIINLFVAVIMDNFDYLTRDWSILGPHHLEEYVRTWSEYDPDATGRMKHVDIVSMLKRIEPPLGFGKCCPHREACKRLVSMNMMMNNDGTVDFHATLFALVRTSLSIKKPDVKSKGTRENRQLRRVITNIWNRTSNDMLNRIIKQKTDDGITVGKFYATFLIQEYFRRFKKKRQEENRKKNADNAVALKAGLRTTQEQGPKIKRAISGDLQEQAAPSASAPATDTLGAPHSKEEKRRSWLGGLFSGSARAMDEIGKDTDPNVDKKRPVVKKQGSSEKLLDSEKDGETNLLQVNVSMH